MEYKKRRRDSEISAARRTAKLLVSGAAVKMVKEFGYRELSRRLTTSPSKQKRTKKGLEMLFILLFIAIFGYLGYLLAPKLKLSGSRRVNVILLVLLVLSFYARAEVVRVFDVALHLGTVLVGLIGGILLRRLI